MYSNAWAFPEPVLWKTELMFRGVRYTPELTEAVRKGAAQSHWPYTRRDEASRLLQIPVPYLFQLANGSVARVRVDDSSELAVRRSPSGAGLELWDDGTPVCPIDFVPVHSWQSFRTSDGFSHHDAGVEQLGDMLVVNVAPGCEYHCATNDTGISMKCAFCGHGRFDARSQALGQLPGQVAPAPNMLRRLEEVLRTAADSGETHHVYVTGGSLLSPAEEASRYLPVVAACRRAVGDRLTVTCGSGALDKHHSRRLRDGGADSCCYNMESWDEATFAAALPGKARFVGRERWIIALLDAVDIFGWGRVASAFVAGIEMLPPAPGMDASQMLDSIGEGAAFLMDHGIMPLYSPLWPVSGTAYRLDQGLQPQLYLELEMEAFRMREERCFPVPSWLTCPGCSHMLLEVDFDREYGLAA